MRKLLSYLILCIIMINAAYSQSPELFGYQAEMPPRLEEPEELRILRASYRNVLFATEYDAEKDDWKVTVSMKDDPERGTLVLCWAGGALIPEDRYDFRNTYDTVIYEYYPEIPDPADFSREHVQWLRDMGEGTAPVLFDPCGYLFDFIYDAETRWDMEQHTRKITFLGLKLVVHEDIIEPLRKVEKMINDAAETDKEMRDFLKTLKSIDAYNWRPVRGAEKRSFHSYGLALDFTPKSYKGKVVYWGWTHDFLPAGWMLVSLKERWIPPASFIEAFDVNGFIWGGYWDMWDNMHFEYRPELLLNRTLSSVSD